MAGGCVGAVLAWVASYVEESRGDVPRAPPVAPANQTVFFQPYDRDLGHVERRDFEKHVPGAPGLQPAVRQTGRVERHRHESHVPDLTSDGSTPTVRRAWSLHGDIGRLDLDNAGPFSGCVSDARCTDGCRQLGIFPLPLPQAADSFG